MWNLEVISLARAGRKRVWGKGGDGAAIGQRRKEEGRSRPNPGLGPNWELRQERPRGKRAIRGLPQTIRSPKNAAFNPKPSEGAARGRAPSLSRPGAFPGGNCARGQRTDVSAAWLKELDIYQFEISLGME